MSKNYAIIIQFVLPLTTFYRSGAQRSNVYKRDAFVTSWRSHNRAWQPRRHDRLSETSRTLWIHRGALTNQRCSLATGCGIIPLTSVVHENGLSVFRYSDVIMGTIATQITGFSIVYSTVCSGADQRKHQSPESLALVGRIHRWPVNSPHNGPVTRKMFPFDDVIMLSGAERSPGVE